MWLKNSITKITNWEYWPLWLVYGPVSPYWLWLGIKARSFFYFSASNPLLTNGGFVMVSKKKIYDLIPQQFYPETLFCEANSDFDTVEKLLKDKNLSFPLIAKPDMGQRGVLVKLIDNISELKKYFQKNKMAILLQEFIDYKNEAGIFYYRYPQSPKGKITGIVGKEYMKIIGDGKKPIETLIKDNPRYRLQYSLLRDKLGNKFSYILPKGETLTLSTYGNHSLGAKFLDLSDRITPELEETIDRMCQKIPSFYYGRLDIKFNTWEALGKGENLSIIELNGAGSEPAHMYDPKHGIFFAWYEIIRHWSILYRISKINSTEKTLPFMTNREGIKLLKETYIYLNSLAG